MNSGDRAIAFYVRAGTGVTYPVYERSPLWHEFRKNHDPDVVYFAGERYERTQETNT